MTKKLIFLGLAGVIVSAAVGGFFLVNTPKAEAVGGWVLHCEQYDNHQVYCWYGGPSNDEHSVRIL